METKHYLFLFFLVCVGIGMFTGKPLFKMLRKRKDRKQRENYLRGRNWAKAESEKGKTVEQIMLTADNPWDSDDFERGALDWCLSHQSESIRAKVAPLKVKADAYRLKIEQQGDNHAE